MGRTPCCDRANVKKGQWTPEEDSKLKEYMERNGTEGNWIALPQKAGLRRCGKSCRLRWLNYLRPNIKHGEFTDDEERIICSLFASIGSRWSIIAGQLPGRTDNDIKNYWNTKLKKKFHMGMVPSMQQKNHPLAISYSLNQNSSVESPYSTSNNNYYTSNPASSIRGYDTMTSTPTYPLESTCITSTDLQAQDGYVGVGAMHNNQIKDSHLIIFGSGEASCSSSDGSCTTNHIISHGQEVVQYDHGFSSHFSSGIDEYVKLMLTENGDSVNGYVYEDSLDYNIEVMKQLDYTNNFSTNQI
ncbi:unnamed protein product [Fraxinus pennsylvanica]|uniref:Uncharacterized protein n=1 Tax=Fraxinus pennsylvanica TaxID=56036 RepID=A0AAD2A5J4_9LAMI|nr:unnamed protein product [Fraxinus pennsylvanica]